MQRSKMLTLMGASFVASFIAACQSTQITAGPATTTKITVSAAASLQAALDEITPQFTQAHPTIAVDYNFGASGALQRQIEQGAPVDIFFAAATTPMDTLAQNNLIEQDSRQNIVSNTLSVIAPLNSPLTTGDIHQLNSINIRRFAVGEFRSVPAGQYAQEVLANLNLLKQFKTKFVFGNNVRSVLTAVESGNVDIGVVYATDAALSPQIKVLLTVPTHLHQPIVYPVARVQGSSQPEAAQSFIHFLTTEQAQSTFQDFGFGAI